VAAAGAAGAAGATGAAASATVRAGDGGPEGPDGQEWPAGGRGFERDAWGVAWLQGYASLFHPAQVRPRPCPRCCLLSPPLPPKATL
jgi:hypothetical protein